MRRFVATFEVRSLFLGIGALAKAAKLRSLGMAANNLAVGTGAIETGTATGAALSNPVPRTIARVISAGRSPTTLGRPGMDDVFVTAADDIAGLSAAEIAQRLTMANSASGYVVIEMATPYGIASPINRLNLGFVGRGLTAGGAREYVIPNGPIPADAYIRLVR